MITFSNNTARLMGGQEGAAHAAATDMVLETTWGRAINDKVCYLYDYWHDD